MNLEQNFPQVSGPFLDAGGAPTQEWQAFFRALWNRTGGAPGSSTDDAAILALLTGETGQGGDGGKAAATSAGLLAVTPKAAKPNDAAAQTFALALQRANVKPNSAEAELLALSLARAAAPDDLTQAYLFALSLFRGSAKGSGVTSFNTRTGAIVVAAGANIAITESPTNTFTIDATNYVPMATGAEPLTFMSNGSGQPMLIPFAP